MWADFRALWLYFVTFYSSLPYSKPHFRGLARVRGDGPFLFTFVFKSAPKPIQRPWALWPVCLAMVIFYSSLYSKVYRNPFSGWALPGAIFEVWPACLAMVISDSSVYSKVHRNPFGGPGPFHAAFSRFRPRAWRWSFPIKVGGPFQA